MQNNNTFLQNETIYLRAVELSDVDTLYRWENDTTQWATANTHAPLSRTQLWNYANDYDGDIYARRNIRFMICLNETNTAIGTVDIYDFDPANSHASIGVYISRAQRGKGYGNQALEIVERYAGHCIGIRQLMATVAADNTASQAMLLKAGYTLRGTLLNWLRHGELYKNALIYQLSTRQATE